MTLRHPGKPRNPRGSIYKLRWRWCNAGHQVIAYTMGQHDHLCKFHRLEEGCTEIGHA